MTVDAVNSIPLWLLYDDEVDAWRAARTPFVKAWLSEHNFKGEKHRVLLVPDTSGGLEMAVGGLGKRQGGLSMWHAAGFPERLPPRRFRFAQGWSDSDATQLCLGFAYGSYRFERYRPSKSDRPAIIEACANADQDFVAHAAESLKLARDLINTPASDLGPTELAAAARQLAERHGASYRQWVGEELLAAKFPAIHAVGRASASAPRLVDIQWSPPGGGALPRLTLVGKGVCFDSGGLDIKHDTAMLLMKKDMGGAASILALAHMIMDRKLDLRLRVLIPAVENAISGAAFRPLDVYRSRNGLRVEVGNTDAEGRLILADALALADEEAPQVLIDMGTLTGAARTALGPDLPPFYTDDDALAADVARHGRAENDPLWRLPLWRPYDQMLDSKVADMSNVATGGFAGSIVCALFLNRFVTAAETWLHFDIYAWTPAAKAGRPEGGECQAARALYALLTERYG